MNIFLLDIGTNSTQYLIADVSNLNINVIKRGLFSNQLGMNSLENGELTIEQIEHNRNIFQQIAQLAKEFDCNRIDGIGTHALRNAPNRDVFIKAAAHFGITLKVIPPEAEAELAWLGTFGQNGANKVTGVLDIGGGSTELSVGTGKLPAFSESKRIGSVAIFRKCFTSDPPSKSEIDSARNFIHSTVSDWSGKLSIKQPLIGTAGTITATVAIHYQVMDYSSNLINGKVLNFEDVKHWSERLLRLTYEERLQILGMPQQRAKFIHSGVLLLKELMDILERDSIEVIDRGILYGLAYQYLNQV